MRVLAKENEFHRIRLSDGSGVSACGNLKIEEWIFSQARAEIVSDYSLYFDLKVKSFGISQPRCK